MAKLACGGTHPVFRSIFNGQYESTQKFIGMKSFDFDENDVTEVVTDDESKAIKVVKTLLSYDVSDSSLEKVAEFERYAYRKLSVLDSNISIERHLDVYGIESNLPDSVKSGPKYRYETDLAMLEMMKSGDF